MASEKRCALIRQTWYEAAKKRMKDGARLAFYETCFEYEFYGREPEEELFAHDDAMLMFEMVRDDLSRDMVKAENIAMRNRRNGMLGGRPPKGTDASENSVINDKPKETQENPNNPNGNFGVSTTLHNTTQHNNKEVSLSVKRQMRRHEDTDRYDFFRCLFVFFYSGAVDPAAEALKFYNYYEARDWQVGRGQPVKNKVALAKTWDIKDADAGLIKARKMYAGLIESIDPDELELINDFEAMIKDEKNKTLTIKCKNGNRIQQILETKYLTPLSIYFFNVLKLDGYTLLYNYIT